MLEIQGRYTFAKVFATITEENLINQIQAVVDHPIFEGCQIRIMPDCRHN